jgi:hypothetical protein
MNERSGRSGDLTRPAGRWPGRPLLAARLREILRHEFGAQDAWIVCSPGRCRLEARCGWRIVVLLEGHEPGFWAPFYTTVRRSVRARGEIVTAQVPAQRSRRDLVELLRPLWVEAVGIPSVRRVPTPPN